MALYTATQNILPYPTMWTFNHVMIAWMAPCFVVSPRLWLLVKEGSVPTTAYAVCLLALGPIADSVSRTATDGYPSFLHCLTSLDDTSGNFCIQQRQTLSKTSLVT